MKYSTTNMRLPTPYYHDDQSTLYHGEALALLTAMPAEFFDATVTDPPYSSGGLFRGDRAGSMTTRSKYQQTSSKAEYPDFAGDTRDQRGFRTWCAHRSTWSARLPALLGDPRPGSSIRLPAQARPFWPPRPSALMPSVLRSPRPIAKSRPTDSARLSNRRPRPIQSCFESMSPPVISTKGVPFMSSAAALESQDTTTEAIETKEPAAEKIRPADETIEAAGEPAEETPPADQSASAEAVAMVTETREEIALRIHREQIAELQQEIADLAVQMADHQAKLTNLKKDYKGKVQELANLRARGPLEEAEAEETYPLLEPPEPTSAADQAAEPAYKSLPVKELGYTEKEAEALNAVDVATIGDLQARIDRLGFRWTDAMPGYGEEFRGRPSDLFFEFFKTHPADQPPADHAEPPPAVELPAGATEAKTIRLIADVSFNGETPWKEGDVATAYVDRDGDVFLCRNPAAADPERAYITPEEYEDADVEETRQLMAQCSQAAEESFKANPFASPAEAAVDFDRRLARIQSEDASATAPTTEDDDQAACVPIHQPTRKRKSKRTKAK